MQLRRYCQNDLAQMAELFYQTVHATCVGDYSPAQLSAWATGEIDEDSWHARYSASYTLIALQEDKIIGFGNMDSNYLDMLYVHKDHQRQGVATALCDALEKAAAGNVITVHASITAKPFFEQRGYHVISSQTVICRGVEMINYIMEKDLG